MNGRVHCVTALIAFGMMATATWAEGTRPPRLPKPEHKMSAALQAQVAPTRG